jgi:hypothetical protein
VHPEADGLDDTVEILQVAWAETAAYLGIALAA